MYVYILDRQIYIQINVYSLQKNAPLLRIFNHFVVYVT